MHRSKKGFLWFLQRRRLRDEEDRRNDLERRRKKEEEERKRKREEEERKKKREEEERRRKREEDERRRKREEEVSEFSEKTLRLESNLYQAFYPLHKYKQLVCRKGFVVESTYERCSQLAVTQNDFVFVSFRKTLHGNSPAWLHCL